MVVRNPANLTRTAFGHISFVGKKAERAYIAGRLPNFILMLARHAREAGRLALRSLIESRRACLARECGCCIALSVVAFVALGADGPDLAKLSRPTRRAGGGSFFMCNLANLAKVALSHLRLVGKIVDAA